MKELDKILEEHEKVLWEGRPSFWPYIFGSSIGVMIFGVIWMVFLIPFIGMAFADILFGTHIFGFAIFLLPHFWIGLIMLFGLPLYQILSYEHVYYAITDKRVILQKGLIGRDFEIVDFDQITNATVEVGIVDKIFKKDTGSIMISSAGTLAYSRRGAVNRPYVLHSIINPYEVFKFFKKITHDVKTDISYPNKLRPKENPGYNTEYNPKK